MRRMIARMIATGSLSAFSSAALPGLPSQAARGVGGVQQARFGQPQQPVQAAPQPQLLQDQGKPGTPATGRIPPRGSLIDLTV
jgi:hypothetical protein